MRVLCVTKIFPNALEPLSAPFNRQQFAALAKHADVSVMATIPWFPFARAFRGKTRTARYHDVPKRDVIDGLPVSHPRFGYVPKVGDAIAAPLYAASLLAPVLAKHRDVDVILASWSYPDGVASVALGMLLGVPVVVKLHGSDVHVLGERSLIKPWLAWGLSRAASVVAVSDELRESAIALGAPRDRSFVVKNGVDGALFSPRPREEARAKLGVAKDAKLVLYVGRVEEEKGALDLAGAFLRMSKERSDVSLVVVGDGGAKKKAESMLEHLGSRARFVGAKKHDELPTYLAACDLLTLPSWHEGTPNVILEALASGRRVVATNVGGIPAAVHDARLGELVPPKDPAALAKALSRAIDVAYDPMELASLSGVSNWDESARSLFSVLERALAHHARRAEVLA